MSKANLKQQLEAFEKGIFLDSEGNESWCFNFYDWFCNDSSLKRKSTALFKKVKTFLKHFDIDTENTYVSFKNNCPMDGSLYDDFRICDVETGNVIFTVVPKCGHNSTPTKERATISGRRDQNPNSEFEMDIYVGSTLSEIYKNK